MNKYTIFLIALVLFFSGCSNYVEYLSPSTKKHIYNNAKDEIQKQIDKGNISYETGYLADSITAYEIVNFYENSTVISHKKIKKIKKQIEVNSKYHYKLALEYLKKDKKRALFEFNNVIKNIPNYKDAKDYIGKLKKEPKIIRFIDSLEKSLKQALKHTKVTTSNLKKINLVYLKLKKYNLQNPLLKSTQTKILLQYTQLRDKAITLYNNGYLSTANKIFTDIKSIYKHDKIVNKYLLIIKNIQKEKALTKKTDKGTKEKLSNLLSKAIKNYNNKNLNKSLEKFQEILNIYPENETALIYIKKIKMQLQTIKSLE